MEKSHEGNFCRAIKPEVGSGFGVQDVVGFYEVLVKVVDADEKNLEAGRSLEDTFRRVFIVLDKEEWEKERVLIICREESVAEHGLGEENEEEGRFKDGKWAAYRKSLSEAVKGVICDPERRKAAAPVEEAYREKKFQL